MCCFDRCIEWATSGTPLSLALSTPIPLKPTPPNRSLPRGQPTRLFDLAVDGISIQDTVEGPTATDDLENYF